MLRVDKFCVSKQGVTNNMFDICCGDLWRMTYQDNIMIWKLYPQDGPFVRGINLWQLDFPHKVPVMWILMFSFNVILEKFLNKQSSCQWFELPWCSGDVTIILTRWISVCLSKIYAFVTTYQIGSSALINYHLQSFQCIFYRNTPLTRRINLDNLWRTWNSYYMQKMYTVKSLVQHVC